MTREQTIAVPPRTRYGPIAERDAGDQASPSRLRIQLERTVRYGTTNRAGVHCASEGVNTEAGTRVSWHDVSLVTGSPMLCVPLVPTSLSWWSDGRTIALTQNPWRAVR